MENKLEDIKDLYKSLSHRDKIKFGFFIKRSQEVENLELINERLDIINDLLKLKNDKEEPYFNVEFLTKQICKIN